MFDRLVPLVAALMALAAVAVTWSGASGQETTADPEAPASPGPDETAALEHRLDSLLTEWNTLRLMAGITPVEAIQWATPEVQGIALVIEPGEEEDGRAALEVGLEKLPTWVGTQSMTGTVLHLPSRGRPAPASSPNAILVKASRWAAGMDVRVRKGLSEAVRRSIPSDVTTWIGIQDVLRDPDPRATYTELIASGLEINQRCLNGDDEACVVALGLSGSLAMDALSGVELRRMVASNLYWGPGLAALRKSCVDQGDDQACADIATSPRGLGNRLTLLGGHSRFGVLKTALSMGGEGALQRLIEPTSVEPVSGVTLSDRLESAARVPMESVIQEWRASLIARPPDGNTPKASVLFAALAWLGLLGFFTSRSTRWRIR